MADIINDDSEFGILENQCYGGYGLSCEIIELYCLKKGLPISEEYSSCIPHIGRDDPILIECFHQLGSENSSGPCSKLAVRYFPSKYRGYLRCEEYDGIETYSIDYEQYLKYLVTTLDLENASKQELYNMLKQIQTDINPVPENHNENSDE